MKFLASINVMPIKEILDPQGKAVLLGLKNLEINQVSDCRIGKHITLALEADNKEKAEEIVDLACKKLLTNQIMESYTFTLEEAN